MAIQFEAKVSKIGSWNILKLPKSASAKLPSRGMVLISGTMNGTPFKTVLEPDGVGSHWFRVSVKTGSTVKLEIEPSKDWPEPDLPTDLKKELAANSQVNTLWVKITTMARWDWIRWINATKDLGTRKHRIEVALSKLKKGEKRPCCFNRTMCTVQEVSKGGVLLEESVTS